MKNDYTHIAVILDRSGSMESIRDDIIGGFNAFLRQQKIEPGIATLTLVQFDSQDPYEAIHQFKLITAVPELDRKTFVPRASTPLLDAMGRGIIDLENTLAKMEADVRPGRVVMAIITDGQENSSREFRKSQIQKMIKEKQDEAGWQFVFLSADLSAIEDAMDTGIKMSASLAFDADAQGVSSAWSSLSDKIASSRRSSEPAPIAFDEADRNLQKNERKRKK